MILTDEHNLTNVRYTETITKKPVDYQAIVCFSQWLTLTPVSPVKKVENGYK